MKNFFHKAGSFLLAIPHSYASSIFSDSILLGLFLLLVTFISPIVGFSGLVGLITALFFSRLMGWEHWDSRSGIAAFNSLMICLTMGYYYPSQMISNHPGMYFGILVLLSLGTMLLYFLISYLFNQWFRLPPMSMAFSIVAIILWHYLARIGYLTNYPFDKLILLNWEPALSDYWRMFFISLGSVFFAPTIVGGIIVSAALLIITRIGFTLALLGWTISFYLMQAFGATFGTGMFYPGFNGIIIMMAVGGIFLLPSKSSWFIAALATAMGFALIMLFGNTFYYFNVFTGGYTPLIVPVFAFPLNIMVLLVVFTLRLRLINTKPIMNDYGIYNPEQALQSYQERFKRFSTLGIPQFYLPVSGQWKITQGHNGEHTHKLDWAYAWDFEMEDRSGKRFSGDETKLMDYYSYGKSVVASASGYVVKALDGVEDNAIGGINTRENWGNYLCLSHGYGLYSFYAHLKNGSLLYKEGDYVGHGEKIALIGNSGRSPLPHLHFQIQIGSVAGSKTRFSHILSYKIHASDKNISFVSEGVPKANEVVSPLVPEAHLQSIMCLQPESEHHYQVTKKGKSTTETWKVDLDLYGSFRIRSSNKSILEFSVYQGIFNSISLKKRRVNALSAFALVLSRMPYMSKGKLSWQDEPALSLAFSPFFTQLILFFSPLFSLVKIQNSSTLEDSETEMKVSSTIEYRFLGLPFDTIQGEVTITKYTDISEIKIIKKDNVLLHARGEKS